jgi:hypothetical protein
MSKISRDFSTGNLHPRENTLGTGALAALNAELIIDADGASTTALAVTGTYVGTLTVEGTIDGTNWDVIPIKPVNAGGLYVLTLASAAVGRWQGPIGWCRKIKVRMSAWTSGTANVVLMADNGVTDVTALIKAADQSVTVTAAASTAATLTLPAPGAGLFHFITRIIVQRHASALLTAGATPVLVTTTNLPGSRVFSIPADAAAAGSVYSEEVSPSNPLRSSAANTATTIVAPLTTGVIWRMTADYYNAPA